MSFFQTSKNLKLENEVGDLQKALDSINIVKASYDNSYITIHTDFDTEINTLGIKNILSQVILNILSNAQDALIQNKIKNKKVTFSLRQSKELITITVKDNGGGIRNEIIDKIFDPYFTTKHQSQGTGLGLYMSSQIIQKHFQGHLSVFNVEDSDGLGACFVLEFLKNK